MRTPMVRLTVALLSGVIVFAVLNVAAWYNLRGARNVCRRQDDTRRTLRFTSEQLTEFQKEHGEFPANLTEIPDLLVPEKDVDGRPVDAWGNPIQYSFSADGFALFSFGRDGNKGGAGLDAELRHDERNREETLATFRQFFLERDSAEVDISGFLMAGLVAGGMVAFVVFNAQRNLEREGQQLTRLQSLASATVVIVLACVVGAMLLPFHIPSGH